MKFSVKVSSVNVTKSKSPIENLIFCAMKSSKKPNTDVVYNGTLTYGLLFFWYNSALFICTFFQILLLLYPCCAFSVLHSVSISVSFFPCCTFLDLHFSCCILFVLHSLCIAIFMLHFFRIAFFSCFAVSFTFYILFVLHFFILHFFPVAIF